VIRAGNAQVFEFSTVELDPLGAHDLLEKQPARVVADDENMGGLSTDYELCEKEKPENEALGFTGSREFDRLRILRARVFLSQSFGER
jgi:DNA polymerase/3'-5' exonuclease PolX